MNEPAKVFRFPVKTKETMVLDLPPQATEPIPDRTLPDLLHVGRNVMKGAHEIVSFVDNNRERAKELGIETIAIELAILLETGRLERVLEELEQAAAEGRAAQVSDEGMRRLRKAEKLISEANTLRKPVIGGLSGRRLGQAIPPPASTSTATSNSTSIWIPLAILGAVVVVVGIATSFSGDSKKR